MKVSFEIKKNVLVVVLALNAIYISLQSVWWLPLALANLWMLQSIYFYQPLFGLIIQDYEEWKRLIKMYNNKNSVSLRKKILCDICGYKGKGRNYFYKLKDLLKHRKEHKDEK